MVFLHVKNLKILHINKRASSKTVTWLDQQYPDMMVTRGKKHNYLGMHFDFLTPGEVQIGMNKFISGTADAFPEELSDTIPVDKDKDKKLLPEKQTSMFHHIEVKLIFSAFRLRMIEVS